MGPNNQAEMVLSDPESISYDYEEMYEALVKYFQANSYRLVSYKAKKAANESDSNIEEDPSPNKFEIITWLVCI